MLFELDANSVVDVIISTIQNISKFGFLVYHCRIFLCENSGFKICYVKRQANVIAHIIMRASHFHANPTVFTYPLVCIHFFLSNE